MTKVSRGAVERRFDDRCHGAKLRSPPQRAPLCLAKYRLPDPGQFDILAFGPAWWRIGCNSINYIGASSSRCSGGATGFYCPGGYLARRVTQLGDAITSRGGRRQAALFGLSCRRLYRDVGDDRGQQSAGGQEVEPGLEASRAVLDPTDDERPDVAAEIADRVDEGDSTRGRRPGEEQRRQRPERRLRAVKPDRRH